MRAIKVPLLTLLLLAAAHVPASAATPDSPPLARNPDIARGEQLFAVCAACHGPGGGGKQDGSVPAIAAQHSQVLTKLLLDFRYFRRWDSRMVNASASDHLRGPQEIADVVAYVSNLPPERAAGIGTGEHLAAGARVYALRCAMCHGAQARGDGPAGYPRLAGQQYAYTHAPDQQWQGRHAAHVFKGSRPAAAGPCRQGYRWRCGPSVATRGYPVAGTRGHGHQHLPDDDVIEANLAAYELAGVTPESVLGKRFDVVASLNCSQTQGLLHSAPVSAMQVRRLLGG